MSASYLPTVRYWFDVEALTYPDIPKPGQRPVLIGRYAGELPWHKAATEPDSYKYFVYFGLVEKQVLEAELAEVFQVKPETASYSGNHVRAAKGNTFLFAMEITSTGEPVTSSLQLAAFSIAIAERKGGRRIGYSLLLPALQEQVEALSSTLSAGVDAAWFDQVTEFLIGELGWWPRALLARAQWCAHKVALVDRKGKKLSKVPAMDPINSFYLDDLERIRVDAEQGAGSPQVHDYLNGNVQAAARQDVTTFDAVNAALAAHRFPMGRWPTKFPLFLMQQVAVNTGLAALKNGGVFSVNGPPGTGKTTLLMDVIAARIIERAGLLAQVASPEQLFSRAQTQIDYPPNAAGIVHKGNCFLVDDVLLDGGIVVASANNKAVENISLDLPNLEKVFPQPLLFGTTPFDYFSATAQSILNPEIDRHSNPVDDDDPPGPEYAPLQCWGLVSVPLGNKKNRNLVAGRLGKFGECGLADALAAIPASELDWAEARQAFNAAVARVRTIQDAIARHDAILPALADARIRFSAARRAHAAAATVHQCARAALVDIEQHNAVNAAALTVNLRERELHAREWPWWRQLIARVFRQPAFARFRAQQGQLAEEYTTLRERRAAYARARLVAATDEKAAASALDAAETERLHCDTAIASLEQQRMALQDALGTAAFDPYAFAQLSVDEQQKSLPRSNAAYHAARAEVFVAAMHLHKAFLKHAGKPFETNFRLALAMLAQEAYLQPHLPKIARHLWATFFLAIPVVSSTFASMSRCFRDLGEGQIGLLLVDEAGQAVPSHALGAIWRAKRALIVGDPLQVEPVIKMDKQLDLAMLTYHQAPEEHLLTGYSAQHLADRSNRYGAHVMQYDGSDLWVGAPLRVHRRCVDPMFSLSNDIAYNSKMVLGSSPTDEQQATIARPLLGATCWHDVALGDFDEHFSVAEGNAAVAIVIAYAQNGWVSETDGLPDMLLISPFKSVADALVTALRERADAWAGDADDEGLTTWLDAHVGTVHKFQGRESESVVFVLGGRTAGARNWAAGQPNIINVAVTRAKRRLYVIGNRRDWSQTVFGKKLADAVPARHT